MTASSQQDIAAPDGRVCQALLERVLASVPLKRATRLREMLAYIGQRALEGGCDQIREQEIGTAVFGRPDSYDTGVDNIVRVNATELRKRLDSYFETEGLAEPVIMEIPRGSYVPVFRFRAVAANRRAEESTIPDLPDVVPASPASEPAAPRGQGARTTAIGLAAVGIALAAGCIGLWMQNRAMNRLLYPWRETPAVATFWSQFLDSPSNTDVVIADSAFGLAQAISKKSFTLQDYISRSYISQLQSPDLSPDTRAALSMFTRRTLVSRSGFALAQHILTLDPTGRNIHIYFARGYLPSLVKRDNVILLGGQRSNPWVELFDSRLNFVTEWDIDDQEEPNTHHGAITNRAPAEHEQRVYTPAGSNGYCAVAYLPNPDSGGKILLIQGTGSEAAQACGDFLLSEQQMSGFKNMLHASEFPYFELLLKTSQVVDTPLAASLEAYRTYPNLH